MSELLSFSELEACLAIEDQSDGQLEYTFKEMTSNKDEFDVVEYMIVPKNKMCFSVKKDFFIMAVLFELSFRELV